MQRRELLTSFKKPFENDDKLEYLRPPYFKNDSDFTNVCIRCETKDCAKICEEQIIIIQEDGTPILNFASVGCTYCDECAISCKYDVLKLENKQNINAIFTIDTIKCMSHNGIMCFSCKDPCLDNAITFDGVFKPVINTDLCTSCGFCVGVCPSDAISIKIKE
jgi:ferredoxin-type protein NapF